MTLTPHFQAIAKSPGSWPALKVCHLTELLAAEVHHRLDGVPGSAPASWLVHARDALKDVLEEVGVDSRIYEGRLDGGGFFEIRIRSAIDRLADVVR